MGGLGAELARMIAWAFEGATFHLSTYPADADTATEAHSKPIMAPRSHGVGHSMKNWKIGDKYFRHHEFLFDSVNVTGREYNDNMYRYTAEETVYNFKMGGKHTPLVANATEFQGEVQRTRV